MAQVTAIGVLMVRLASMKDHTEAARINMETAEKTFLALAEQHAEFKAGQDDLEAAIKALESRGFVP